MGRRLPESVIQRIKARFDDNQPVPAIALALNISKTTIYKLKLSFDIFGAPYAPTSVKNGRPRSLTEHQERVRRLRSCSLQFTY
ncbi:hypothetical protein M501DRAFT_1003031 [Patellaria atrata CBS 101060]|uniref:Helix-turn-helix domain-containing protein n=1 Tax=Patellaria atrata CBS 101060 TaxID=1346257 RepID=A0A9P4SBF7_9PEZI|nr:hypothetical protein M501DRAFT_1003031 [Patellaria atrata CBS 101060]